jgi:hypothetical protein
MGLIFLWTRLAMLAPGLVNAALGAPLVGSSLKWATGFTRERDAPLFASEFQNWLARRDQALARRL